MTAPHETHDESDEAVDRWLFVQHRHLLDRVDATVDIEAGLQAIFLHSQHVALVESLNTDIDVEANLAMILSSERTSVHSELDPSPAHQSADASASSTLPPEKRITLRTEPSVMWAYLRFLVVLALKLDLRLVRDLDLDLARDLASGLARARDLARDLDLVRAGALIVARVSALNLARGGARTRARDLAGDLACVRVFPDGLAPAEDIDHDLDGVLEAVDEYLNRCRHAIERALGCRLPGRDAEAVEAFLDDFTDANLGEAKLNDVDLTGVRWSDSGTRWPPGMDIEALKRRSTFQGNGIWVVQRDGGTATVPDSVGVS